MTESEAADLTLVFGDDGSPAADTAWTWIAAQPWSGWRVDVMTADADPGHTRWGEPADLQEWIPSWHRSPLDDATVRFFRAATDPRVMLADRDEADLVVVGRRSGGYRASLVTGSTAEWLLHHPPAPLVLARTADPVASAVLCVDGSAHAGAAQEAFTRLPLAASAELTVLGVDDGRSDASGAVEEAVAAVEQKVGAAASLVIEGRPTEAILGHLEEARPQLVVLGTRGLTGWARLRLGSTASAVVRAAPCTSLVAGAGY